MDHQQKDETAVAYLATAMNTKLARARAKGRSGWDSPECTQQHLSNLLREHVEKGDPVDVANFCAFLAARGEGIAPRQCLAQPIAGYRISDPSDPTIKPWLSDTPDDNGYTSEPLYAGAAPAAVAPQGGYPPLPAAAWEARRVRLVLQEDAYTAAQMRAYFDLGRQHAAAPVPEASAAPVHQVLTDAQITHLQETRVGEPSPSRPIDASDWTNFARAIEAAALAALAKCGPALPVDVVRAAHAAMPDELAARLRKAAATLAVRHSSYSNISIAWPDEKLLKSAEGRYHQALADLDALIDAIPGETKQTADRDQLDSLARKKLGVLLNAFGEAQWQAGRGVPCPSIEDAFEAVISAAVDLLAAAPQAPAAPSAEGLREQHDSDSAELRRLCQARDEARRERDIARAEIAGLQASTGHLSALVDGQHALLEKAKATMTALHGSASPIDESGGDFDARIPASAFARFVDEHAALLHAMAQSPVAAPAAPAVDAETVKKAARYDWLRDFHNGPDGVQDNLPHIAAGSDNDLVWALQGDDADAFIDAAIAAQAAAKGEHDAAD